MLSVLIIPFVLYYFLITNYTEDKCITDLLMDLFLPINRLMYDVKTWENVFIGIGQVFIDGWFVFFSIFWSVKIKNFRLPMAVGLTFAVRTLLLVYLYVI